MDLDFLDRLKEFLEGSISIPTPISIGTYKENGHDIAIRPSPSNIDIRYMNKNKVYAFGFQILVHHRENITAYREIERIRATLEDLSSDSITSNNGSFELISMQCTTTPNYVQKTNHGVLWTALFVAEIHIRR